ncbi:MAG: hypothetical protein IT173_00880 [Acidobacteria bacterium]|nr:hypothetical protein [Acidobacteriota bacterium]
MNELIRMSLAMVVFGAIVLSLACGNNTQNSNTAANGTEAVSDPCGAPNADAKIAALKQRIARDIQSDGYTKLEQQLNDKKFGFDLVKFSSRDLIELRLYGRVLGKGKGDKETTMENFFDVIDDYLREGCIQKVTISEKPAGAEAVPGGFEWQLCEYPDVYCDGVCKPSCPLPDAMPPAASNSNSSTNSSSNTNSNTSTNANSNTNANAKTGNTND